MDSSRRDLRFSESFVISCGTVTLDTQRSLVLVIRCRRSGEYYLPKGRKNISEPLEQAALRETFEETGVSVQLLPINAVTNATPASSSDNQSSPTVEPIAVAQRMSNGILKIIFWYVASADATAARVEGTQQEDEDFETVWTGYDQVCSVLTFQDDQAIALGAIAAACAQGTRPVTSPICFQ